MFVVSIYATPRRGDIRWFVTALALMLIIRARGFTSEAYLEQNLAALVAILIPWIAEIAFSCRHLAVVFSGVLSMYLVRMVVTIANRGALVGLAAATLSMWLISPWHWRITVALAPLLLVAALALPRTEVGKRLDEAYQQNAFSGTAAERLVLWNAGLEITREHPIVGVGPGNYTVFLAEYAPHLVGLGAHNSVIDLMAETGYVGAAIYAVSSGSQRHGDWRLPQTKNPMGFQAPW